MCNHEFPCLTSEHHYPSQSTITITIELDAPPRRANPRCETLLRMWVRCGITKPPIQIYQEGSTWWQTPAENNYS